MTCAHESDIPYEVVRSRRRTADIVIERDGRVLVRAPEKIPAEKIEVIIESKRYWIYKNLAEWRDLNATRVLREYKNGEGFLYLGRSYRLLLVADQDKPLLLKGGGSGYAATSWTVARYPRRARRFKITILPMDSSASSGA